jgi:hypothetical protein
MSLSKGDVVTVYEDPITQLKPEGRFWLDRLRMTDPAGLEFWDCHDSDHVRVQRWIKA